MRTAQRAGYAPELLQAVEAVNQFQKQRQHGLISQNFGGAKGLVGRRFALWGLAFKPNTDDMRVAEGFCVGAAFSKRSSSPITPAP